MSIDDRLHELNISLPPPPKPLASYVPAVQTGNLLYIAGQVPIENGVIVKPGKLGAGLTIEEGQALARICTLNALAAAKAVLGSLDRVTRVVRLAGFVASAPGFGDQPSVINGASDLLVQVFGEEGRHARVAVGTNELPRGCAVEIEFLFEVKP